MPRRPLALIDGYNVLHAVQRLDPGGPSLAEVRGRLEELLGAWAEARGCDVIVVWDGRSGSRRSPHTSPPRVQVSWSEAPEEADDRIAVLAGQAAAERREVRVASADRGLLARLPPTAVRESLEQLADDLAALASGPLRAPHVGGARVREVPASAGPVDPAALPRRRDKPRPPAPPRPAAPRAKPRRRRP
ncbi:MAG: NYN domain-containing protein [Acidobacteria bacterium]|nr:NYN domain-containing protein [Acidobacteriota bacterium]